MKSFFALLLLILSVTLNQSLAGNEGGGGHHTENQFFEIAHLALAGIQEDLIKYGDQSLFAGFNINSFKDAISQTEVSAVTELCTTSQDHNNGEIFHRCEDGRYYPDEKLIKISINEWEKKNCLQKASLVVHELGRASGNENGNYKFSSKVIFSRMIKNQCTLYNGRNEN